MKVILNIFFNEGSISGENTDSEAETMDAWNTIQATWVQISPAIEESLKKFWYAAIYSTPGNQSGDFLIIGRGESQFLFDQLDPVQYIQRGCLRLKVGNSNILQPTPLFKVYPMKGGNWEIQLYSRIKQVFNKALKMNSKNTFQRIMET